MSPAKRARKHPPASTPPPSQPEDAPDAPDSAVLDARKDENALHTPPSDTSEIFDLALLDEEDAPGSVEDEARQPEKPSRGTYAVGGGGYNALKSFKGQVYSGMSIGGTHKWNYEPGVWQETKEEPDLWRIDYQTNKNRAKKAPKNSGAPIGTEYHWLIVGHQHVKKVDANTYETHLEGSKYKLAHKAASANSWSIPTVKAQRDREIELLEDAKRRVQGLPPVMTGEKVKVAKHEKGQQKLDSLFGKTVGKKATGETDDSKKRKREENVNQESIAA